MNKNVMRFMALTALGFAYGIIYLLPYMKAVFYDQMRAATGFTDMQLGEMLTLYTIGTTLSYLPGGWIADKFKPKNILTISMVANGILCLVFMMFCTNFIVSMAVWFGAALCGGFAFWPAMLKGVRLLGSKEEQGRIYGVFEALNGLASLLGSLLMVWVSTWYADHIAGFNGAVLAMGSLCFIAAAFFWFSFDENITFNEDALKEKEAIKIKDFFKVLVMPTVWIPSLLLFGGITMYSTSGYLAPYLTDKMLVAAVMVSWLSSFREYGCRIGGVAGGWFADKIFKSSARWQVFIQLLNALTIFAFLFIPADAPMTAIVLMFVFAFVTYANRVTAYSMLSELRVPTRVAGTALAVITLVGYAPDMFVHTMYGHWIDTYGVAGYDKIFTYAGTVGLLCVPIALVGVLLSNRTQKKEQEEAIEPDDTIEAAPVA